MTIPKASRRENILLALKAKVSTAFKREAKVMGSGASLRHLAEESLPFAGRINLLFKPISPRELHESDFHLLRPASKPKNLGVCL